MTSSADKRGGLLARLSRISSSGRLIPEIDGLRFVAIAGVVMTHLATLVAEKAPPSRGDPVYAVAINGFFGVQIFFAISGFILALPFAEAHLRGGPSPGLGAYYLRRVTRLEPPYVINMLLLAALWLAMPGANALELLRRLAASLTYTHNLAYGTGSFINPVAWSLEIEVQLYLTAPLLAAVFALRRRALRRGVLFLALAASAVLSEWGRSKAFTAGVPSLPFYLQYFQYFLTGFLVADFYLTEWQESPRRGFAWDLVGLAAWAGIGAGLIKVSTSRYLLTPLVLLALVAAFRGRVTSALLRLPGIVTVGGMCYTIYLYHFQVLTGLHGFVGALVPDGASFAARFFIELGVLTPPLLALSALLFAFLERPFMRRGWYRRGGGPLRAPGPGR